LKLEKEEEMQHRANYLKIKCKALEATHKEICRHVDPKTKNILD